MVMVILKHTVEDFDRWKQGFDAGEPMRQKAGARLFSLSRDATNPNTVIVITHWESAEQARTFMQSPALREAMAKGGMVGAPESFILEPAR
jgi:quinol monooxygenase YgiN